MPLPESLRYLENLSNQVSPLSTGLTNLVVAHGGGFFFGGEGVLGVLSLATPLNKVQQTKMTPVSLPAVR